MINRRSPQPRRRQSDRRKTSRHEACGRIRFLRAAASADEVLQAELLDVSAGGVRILTSEALKRDERLLMEVRDDEGRCVNLSAVVVWVESNDECGRRVGCELRVDLAPAQLAILKRATVSHTEG